MKCRVLVPIRKVGYSDYADPEAWHPPGAVWDATKAATPAEAEQVLHFVRIGACEPADEECEQACGLSVAQLTRRQFEYRATSQGIWPEDMDLFRQGVIAGYDMDGNYLPGPNAPEPSEEPEIVEMEYY